MGFLWTIDIPNHFVEDCKDGGHCFWRIDNASCIQFEYLKWAFKLWMINLPLTEMIIN